MKTFVYLAGWAASILFSIADLWFVQQAVVHIAIWVGTLRTVEERLRDLSSGKTYGWTVEAVSMTSLLILLCGVVGFEIWAEYYFRRGTTLEVLVKREMKVFILQVIIGLMGLFATVII
jgi:hypothetical protein